MTNNCITKPYLTKEEIDSGTLLDPMSKEGLEKWVKPAPLLRPSVGKWIESLDFEEGEYFMETGEIPPEDRELIVSRMMTKVNEQLNAWHLARALHHRKGNETHVHLELSPYSTDYTFDDEQGILHVSDTNPHRELVFEVCLPYFVPIRPIPLKEEGYSEKVARLSTEQLLEGLEVHHRVIKQIHKQYSSFFNTDIPYSDMSQEDHEALYKSEEWCIAAYLELRIRR
jgi:hypothetical protein